MNPHRKIALGVVLAVVVVGLLYYFVRPFVLRRTDFGTRILTAWWIHQAQQLRVRLLCGTDHQALLDAGREILSQVPIENRTQDGDRIIGELPVPRRVRIPRAIRKLGPRGVLVNYDCYLTLEMHGGMDHFGVRIYPKDFNLPRPNFKYGDRKRIDGLWCYDEGYLHNPDYDKIVDELVEKHRGKRQQKTSVSYLTNLGY